MQSSYDILIQKLDDFIRKYYQNQIIRGVIYSFSLLLLFFLSISIIEYFGEFDTDIRTLLFWGFILSALGIISKFIFLPVSKIFSIGARISNEQAAQIIGNHFNNVSDKLLNILQLKQIATGSQSDLLLASIDQKSIELKPVPFSNAVDFSENKKYLKYALPPLLVFLLILFLYPKLITQSTERIVNHQTYYEKIAPFAFSVKNENMQVFQNEDFLLELEVTGDELPNEVYVETEGNRFRLKKNDKNSFSYLFKNVQNTTNFKLFAGGFFSTPYTIDLLKKPTLLRFSTSLKYPKYIGKKDEVTQNKGDLTVPEGTQIGWSISTENTAEVKMVFADTSIILDQTDESEFKYQLTASTSSSYQLVLSNDDIDNQSGNISYTLHVIKDEFPKIDVEQKSDSLSKKRIYFKGNISDDYATTKLTFNYKHKDSTNYIVEPLANTPSFYHYWDISNIKLNAGDELEYYFQVWDNDGVNGHKSTKSSKRTFKAPTLEELNAKTEKTNEAIKSDMEESIEEAMKIQKELEKMQRKLADKKELDWEDKNKLKELLEQQKELEKKVEQIQTENAKNNAEQNEYKQMDEKILEKQKQIEELFEKVMTDDMKKMFDELEELMDKANKEQLQEMLEKMELSNEDIEKELDRTLELFKQLEFEQKMEETINKLEELAQKQEELSEETKDGKTSNEELQKKQEELQKEFDELQKEMEDLKKKNDELEKPNQMPETEQQEQNIENEMNESSDNLENNKKNKASENQKNAAEQMKEMAQKMQNMMQQMQQQAQQEDIDALRQLLENLIQLSFDQEALMEQVKGLNPKDPKYFDIGKEQKKLQFDAKMIEDSLFALSKRNPQIEPDVNREINAINQNIEQAIYQIQERQTNLVAVKQQYIMTATNNLALMLDEIVQQMQQQMSQQKFGQSSCSKPGSNPQPTPGNMKQMQQQISKQIEQLKKGMSPGQGEQGKGSMGGKMSKELAKLAAEQEALRQQIQDMANKMGNEGNKSGKGNLDKLADMMEENERDLVNRQITQETIKRQQEIMTRLLEHEKAEREREFDDQRQANEAKNENLSNPSEFFEYNRLKQQEEELLRTVAPELSPYYKKKVNSYFQNIKQ